MRRHLVALFAITSAGVAGQGNTAVIPHSPVDVVLAGRIHQSDVAEIKKAISRSDIPPGSIVVHADSPGGDFFAAMEIGRMLRASHSIVMVADNAQCSSACVLVLAGAVNRVVFERARVGVHRPYLSSTDEISFDNAQARYRELQTQTRTFLREMNLPQALWEAMSTTPPERVRALEMSELASFGLVGKDPAMQEVDDAKEARKYGLTKQAYFARKAQARRKCEHLLPSQQELDNNRSLAIKKLPAYFECEEAVLGGQR